MNVAFRQEIARNELSARGGGLARIEIIDDLAAAEPAWRGLLRDGAIASPYQNFDLAMLWQRHVGAPQGAVPLLVTGYGGDDEPIFLLPFCRQRKGPFTVAEFFGGKHCTINMAIWRRDFIAAAGTADMARILDHVGHAGVDLLTLFNQPYTWQGFRNPLALLAHQRGTEDNFRLSLGASGEEIVKLQISATMRGRLRTKERKLASLSGYRHGRVTAPAHVDRCLDAFFVQKSARLAALGVKNVFDEPGVEAFLRAACHHGLESGRPLIELYALECDAMMLALYSGIHDGRRFTSMFNSYALGEHARWSPGLILLQHLVADCADRGFESFDVGAGEARYKSFFCKEVEPLFDSILPLSGRGKLAAAGLRPLYFAKGALKRNRLLWSAIQRARSALART
jgi:CelD/BcsL family acetyltransferase involved in cellulose biosynthesis